MDEELTIGVVSSRSGLAPSALRFYEERGLISSERTAGGQRRYHRDVLRRLALIQAAQRVGLTLEEVGATLSRLPEHSSPDGHEWRDLSASWRPMLDERIRLLTSLRDQLDSCIGCGCLSLSRCKLANPEDRAGGGGPGARYLVGGERPR